MYSGPPASKPYKVCPEVVTAKDTPCRVDTPTASIVHRMEIVEDPREKRIKELEMIILELETIIKKLGEEIDSKSPR